MVIIDDEVLVRKGVISSVDWESHEIEIAGEAADGRSGLELIRTVQPELVLTDIRMPHMDGLQMMKEVREEFPHIRFVILSVLEDFPTVREALKLGAVDYMNKFRMDPDELLQSVLKIKATLVPKNSAITAEKADVESPWKVMREDWLDWLQGTPNEVYDGAIISGSRHVVVVLERNQIHAGTSIKYNELHVQLEAFIEQGEAIACLFIYESSSGWTLFFRMPKDTSSEFEITCALLERMTAMRHACGDTFSCGVSRAFHQASERMEAYREAQAALRLVFYRGYGVYAYDSDQSAFSDRHSQFMEMGDFKKYLICLEGHDDEAAEKAFQTLFPAIVREDVTVTEVVDAVHAWVSSVILLLKDWDGQVPASMLSESMFEQVHSRGTYLELRAWCYHLHQLAREMLVSFKKNANQRPEVQRAIDYIKIHYAEQIRVQDVAHVVNLSENYFSNLFTKEVGKTFSQYLQEIRVEKAKELLRGRKLDWFEVGERVGMDNPKYFSKIFKKYTGCTPIQYTASRK
ncbi:response regulator [Paenibacillus sp. NPDC056579]|uniref:response regulator n=1 Tax=Paenibacillus sp. NPDC056579 TaxID=3345871 RepID=UPI0036D1CD69